MNIYKHHHILPTEFIMKHSKYWWKLSPHSRNGMCIESFPQLVYCSESWMVDLVHCEFYVYTFEDIRTYTQNRLPTSTFIIVMNLEIKNLFFIYFLYSAFDGNKIKKMYFQTFMNIMRYDWNTSFPICFTFAIIITNAWRKHMQHLYNEQFEHLARICFRDM